MQLELLVELKPSYYSRRTRSVLKFYLIPSGYTLSTLYDRCKPVSELLPSFLAIRGTRKFVKFKQLQILASSKELREKP